MKRNLKIFLMGLLFFQLALQAHSQNWEWAEVSGGIGSDYAYGTTTDLNDNVIQVGAYINEDMQVGPFTLTNQGSSDCFISKYDASGALIWARGWGTPGFDVSRRVLTDDQGNIYVVGYFGGSSINFGNGVSLTNGGGLDAFILKLDPNGNSVWARSLAGTGNEFAQDLAITPCGVIWGGSYTSSTASILGNTLTNSQPGSNTRDAFMCLLDLNGTFQWEESYGSTGDDLLTGLANRGGRVYAVGVFSSNITFGFVTHTSMSFNTDGWVAKFKCNDPTSFTWSRSFGGTGADNMNDITVGNGQVFITGNTYSNAITIPGLGSYQVITGGQMKAVLLSYSANGTPLWFRYGQNPGAPFADLAQAVEADQCGHVYLVGRYSQFGVTWSGTTLNSTTTSYNFILLKYRIDGTLAWANHLPGLGGGGIQGEDIAINSLDRPVIAGTLINGATIGGTNYYTNNFPSGYAGDAIVMQMDNELTMQLTPMGQICENLGPVNINILPATVTGTGTWTCPTAPTALANTSTTNNHNNTFDPAVAGPGNHCITFTIPNGNCVNTVTECITVLPAPTVTITGSPSVCIYDQPIDLTSYVSPSGGVFAGPGIAGNYFNPAGAGVNVGPNLVSYTVTNTDGCSDFAYLLINVTDARWHQSSVPSGSGEGADDVITDDQGDVYITGTFGGSTTLTDQFSASQTITTNTSGMYVAKYSRCGNLMWVNHTSSGRVSGTGVTVDDVTGMVYVVGHTEDNAQFEDFCGTNVTNMSITGGYVAQFDMNTGCHLFSAAVPTGIDPEPEAVVSWEGYLYLTGREEAFVGSGVYNVFTTKYMPDAMSGTANQLNGPTWHTFSEPFLPSPFHIGRDIEMDLSQAGGERVVITGDFTKDLRYSAYGFAVSTDAEYDAFYAIFEENSGAVLDLQKFGSKPAPEYSTGTGVAVSPSGRVFLTGTFAGEGPFDPFMVPSPLIGGGNERAYVVFVDPGGWAHELFAGNSGSAQGQAIDASDNELIVSGNFVNEDLEFAGQQVQFNSAPGAFKVYTGAFDFGGTTLWTNATASPGNAYSHSSRAIALGQNDSYFHVGSYRGDVDYLLDNSFSGILPYQFLQTMFAIRGEVNSGEYLKTAPALTQDVPSVMEVFPNPSQGKFTLRASYEHAVVELFSIQGQRVLVKEGQDLNPGLDLDLTSFTKGTYLLRVTGSKGEVSSERIIIQ